MNQLMTLENHINHCVRLKHFMVATERFILKKSVENGIIPQSPRPTGDTDDLVTKIRSPRG